MLDASLNSKILKLAPRYTAKDTAPETFQALKSQATSGLVVWDGMSDQTIYGDNKVNHAFRAWHDSLHLKLNAPFTLEGETIVALEQARVLDSGYHGEIMLAEVIGQARYLAKYGHFPIDQTKFILEYLRGKI